MHLGKVVNQAILVVLGASLASSLPLNTTEPTTDIVSSITNGTFGGDVDPIDPIDPIDSISRGEIGEDLCRYQYMFFHEEWILQVPVEWWKDDERWGGRAYDACNAWINAMHVSGGICGLRITECWEMKKHYRSGGVGWLHARATACVGIHGGHFQRSYRIFHKPGKNRNVQCYHGININPAPFKLPWE
jgi:hypothetical protein